MGALGVPDESLWAHVFPLSGLGTREGVALTSRGKSTFGPESLLNCCPPRPRGLGGVLPAPVVSGWLACGMASGGLRPGRWLSGCAPAGRRPLSWLGPLPGVGGGSPTPRRLSGPVLQMVQSLGFAIYRALDWGLDDSEERELSPQLERLIDLMANNDCEDGVCGAADEGYGGPEEEEEAEGGPRAVRTFAQAMRLCAARLTDPRGAQTHYQAVCRALFVETLELRAFLARVREAKEVSARARAGPCGGGAEEWGRGPGRGRGRGRGWGRGFPEAWPGRAGLGLSRARGEGTVCPGRGWGEGLPGEGAEAARGPSRPSFRPRPLRRCGSVCLSHGKWKSSAADSERPRLAAGARGGPCHAVRVSRTLSWILHGRN